MACQTYGPDFWGMLASDISLSMCALEVSPHFVGRCWNLGLMWT